ncbi:hypothetical protein KXX64_009535, partial [Aspergillus fumigatus]
RFNSMMSMGVLQLSFNSRKHWGIYERKYRFILYLHLLPTPDDPASRTWSTIPYAGTIPQNST